MYKFFVFSISYESVYKVFLDIISSKYLDFYKDLVLDHEVELLKYLPSFRFFFHKVYLCNSSVVINKQNNHLAPVISFTLVGPDTFLPTIEDGLDSL